MSTRLTTVINRMYSDKSTSMTNILAPSYLSYIDFVASNRNIGICVEKNRDIGLLGEVDLRILVWSSNKQTLKPTANVLQKYR